MSGKYEPPLTVASFATTTQQRPSITPIPVTMPGRRRLAVVDLPGGKGVQLQECRAGVDEQVDALPRRELAARAMALGRALAAAGGDERGALP